MKKVTLLMFIVLLFAKCLGFLRDIVLSYVYGASSITDVYVISQTVPTVLFACFGAGIATGFIPMYADIRAHNNRWRADRFAADLTHLLLMFAALLVVFGLIFTEPLVRLFASGFAPGPFAQTVDFTRITLFAMLCSAVVFTATAYLQLHHRTVLTAVSHIPYNLCLIAMVFFSYHYGAEWLAIGTVLGFLLQVLFLVPFVWREGYRHTWTVPWRDPYVRKLFIFSLPVMLSVSVQQLNVLVDRTIASHFADGSISAIAYADRFQLFLIGLISVAVLSSVYPLLSEQAVARQESQFNRTFSEATTMLLLFIVPVSIGALTFSEPLMALLYGRGAFDANDLQMTAGVFFFYSLGMVGLALRELLVKAFYALKDNKTPVLNSVLAIMLNIGLSLTLSRWMGINGLALATAVSGSVCTLLLAYQLYRRQVALPIAMMARTALKIFISGIVAVALARLVYGSLNSALPDAAALLLAIFAALLCYLGFVLLLKVKG